MTITGDQARKYLEMKSYYVLKGDESPRLNESYIFTPTVDENLRHIVRVLSSKSYPILLQGETSVGKTSLIHWLAAATGNQCLRINNHEHTDLSEYLGTYTCSPVTGQLVFQDGPLIKAMRHGWWIILDELNLASSEILEALNRLLDDNRQLFLSETNELINAHERFQLFATQNPAGEQYAGRKRLSRAFRNRFIELHFDNLPQNELETIIEKKCQLPKSYAKLLIQTMIELQKHRSQKGIFAGKSSLITLRDLFRWAQRYTKCKDQCSNYKQFLGEHGYLLLAGRSRHDDDRKFIKEILEKYFCEKKMTIDEDVLFGPDGSPFSTREIWKQIETHQHFAHIVWTQPLRRLAILAGLAVHFDEPTLLVGETGCGKTTICQILAERNAQTLFTVNCHTTTESADFLGSIRPKRRHEDSAGLFEWQDGALVCAMKEGGLFLIDEISLADDSVLERLNSVLEPEKQLVLAEKGYQDDQQHMDIIQAEDKFRLIATMNPGGDFGKKELSPALRNRFTEIWCTPSESIEDFRAIIRHNLRLADQDAREQCAERMCQFIEYLRTMITTKRLLITVRDLLSWVVFINLNPSDWRYSYEHGAYLVFIDGMDNASPVKSSIIDFLDEQKGEEKLAEHPPTIRVDADRLLIGSYSIMRGPATLTNNAEYSFNAPTILSNIQRLLRAMQLNNKPILIEGNPGVGKTSLVMALARLAGYPYIRINLSEQTDISDLFGSDLPDVSGGQAGQFQWHDGPLLTAIKNNQWIILDELNLANQSVLEGLNACLDHRGEIYIPELNRRFFIHDKDQRQPLRIFACQNPYGQVSGRKGLPKSFLNRFTSISFSVLQRLDLKIICGEIFPNIAEETREKMLDFNQRLQEERFASNQWEFNLRDLLKWCQIVDRTEEKFAQAFQLIYVKRMRTKADQQRMEHCFEQTTGWKIEPIPLDFHLDSRLLRIGSTEWPREQIRLSFLSSLSHRLLLLRHQLDPLSSILECFSLSWPILLVGASSRSSKTTLIRLLASLCGHQLNTFELNSSIDTNELLGSYEQFNFQEYVKYQLDRLKEKYLADRREDFSQRFNWSNQEINVEYLQQLKDLFPVDEIEKLIFKSTENQHFLWIESILIRSMRQGHWLILENVNQCSLSVLDRLNSLLEPNGELVLNEGGGQGEGVKPHRDFRLILTMDPGQGNGEISRAMRNRCCEIFVDQPPTNLYDLEEFLQSMHVDRREDFVGLHQFLSGKMSNFGFDHFIRSCSIFKEFSRLGLDNAFRLAMKTAYRTLNSRSNVDIDHLIDEYQSTSPPSSSSSNFLVCPTFLDDLCLQPELILSLKRHQPLWSCSSQVDPRKFQLLFYRFVETISSPSIEIDLFLDKHPEEKSFVEIFHQLPRKENLLLLRLLIEQDAMLRQWKSCGPHKYLDEKLFFEKNDGQFWTMMKEYFIRALDIDGEEKAFEFYRSWRWLTSIVQSSTNDFVSRRLHLIIAWPYIRSLFLVPTSTPLIYIDQIDEQYMAIQKEFLEFYEHYRLAPPYLVVNRDEYALLCCRHQVFDQLDLFRETNNEKSMEKSLHFWTEHDVDLRRAFSTSGESPLDILKGLEKTWVELPWTSECVHREMFFYRTFESILYYRYQWLDCFLHRRSRSIPFLSLRIPFDETWCNADEYFCQLISYSIQPSVEKLYRRVYLPEGSQSSLLHHFNIRSREVPLGLYELIARQTSFWSSFFWLNGSFLQSRRARFDEFVTQLLDEPSSTGGDVCLQLIEQSFRRIDLIRPRGQIDPIIYEEILNAYQTQFHDEINAEYQLRSECVDQYDYSRHLPVCHWEKAMKTVLEQPPREQREFYRLNNDHYENLTVYLSKQLLEQLMNKDFLLGEIYAKKNRRAYEQWRTNLVQFYRHWILAEKFYLYRDVTIPLMKEIFQIVLAFDCRFHLDGQQDEDRSIHFPSSTIQWNLFDMAKDLFEKRTVLQQTLTKERFLQYFCLIGEYLLVYVHLNRTRDAKSRDFLHSYLETVHYLWSEEQRQSEEEKRSSTSLFRHEASELESEEDQREYHRLFPSFDGEFQEFLAESTEPIVVAPIEERPASIPSYLLYEYLRSILHPRDASLNDLLPSLTNSLYEFGDDHRLVNAYLRLSIRSKISLREYFLHLNKPFDIYQDSRPSMIVDCSSMLKSIVERTEFLLLSHDSHPTLTEILRVLQRIHSFSIEQSLIKFLYGFDLLFDKLTYWQQTFSSRTLQTTFDEQLKLLTEKIIEFRRYEYQCYEQTLTMIDYDQRRQTIEQWWLHLFAVLRDHQTNDEQLEVHLHQFFGNATLGDFRTRLEICQTFEEYFPRRSRATLNGVRRYYQQFQRFFHEQIETLRKPIEKELKEFFRIQQWKDTNYYSLKQSIEKSQKFLFKAMKKYKRALYQSTRSVFSSYQVSFASSFPPNDEFFRSILVKFNRKIFVMPEFPKRLGQVKNDCQSLCQIASTVAEMKSNTTDRKQLKQLYTEKRQLLTQLFQKLTSIGLSFRKGLLHFSTKKSFSLASWPIEFHSVSSVQRSYATLRTKRKTFIVDNREETLEKFAKIVEETNDDFYCVIYQHEQLRLTSQKTSLDAIISQRIQGFQEHLITLISEQKRLFQTFLCQYEEFSRRVSLLAEEDPSISLSNIDRLHQQTICLIERIESFRLILRSRPTTVDPSVPIIDAVPSYTQLTNSIDLNALMEKFLEQLKILLTKINVYEEHRMVHHPILQEIDECHRQIVESEEQIRSIFVRVFLDEQLFPDDQFLGQLTKDFLRIYRDFSQLDLHDENNNKQSVDSPVALKPFRRYRRRLLGSFASCPPLDCSSPSWMIQLFDSFQKSFDRVDFPRLLKLISGSIPPNSLLFFQQVNFVLEEFAFRLIYYHRCSVKLYLALSDPFLQLVRDAFQLPPEESEGKEEEQKAEGGISGMGDGTIQADAKDVSDQIEDEDQLDEAQMPGQEKNDEEQQQQPVDDEQNGIEMSTDFDAPMDKPNQDDEENEDDDDLQSEENNEENLDDQMGEVNEEEQGEIFDENKWGEEKNKDEKEEEEDGDEKKPPKETDQATGKDQQEQTDLTARDNQLDLMAEAMDDNPPTPEPSDEQQQQAPETSNAEESVDQTPLELPENLNLDGNDEGGEEEPAKDEPEELPEDTERTDLPEDKEEEEEDETGGNQKQTAPYDLPENLPDQPEDDQLEQSALTKETKPSEDVPPMDQSNDQQQTFANAESFEKEKDRPEQTIGESSSSKKTSQTEQISSNQSNQLTEQLNNESERNDQQQQQKERPNPSDDQRTLSEIASQLSENLQAALDVQSTENERIDDLPGIDPDERPNQLYAHAKEIPRELPQQKQILDAATDQQAKQLPEEEQQPNPLTSEEEEPMLIDNQLDESKKQETPVLQTEAKTKKTKPSSNQQPSADMDAQEEKDPMSTDQPFIPTTTVPYQFDFLTHLKPETNDLTEQVECQLDEWYTHLQEHTNDSLDAEQLWTQLEHLTQPYVFELCEQLRLLLEPTQRTKYSGDYRTGKRLNMKRIIPYIASDFRKDRIWLRRLKPSKRQYQVILAIDDSQSMDNLQVKRLALESLILLGQTLNLLDIGQFGIASFGQYIRMLQPLSQAFNHQNGIDVLKQLKFDQTKTLLAELMESVSQTFSKEKVPTAGVFSQLLIILSDGRGLTVSGKDRLLKSVRQAMSQNIFVVFVILDNIQQEKSTSIFQINEAVFVGEKVRRSSSSLFSFHRCSFRWNSVRIWIVFRFLITWWFKTWKCFRVLWSMC